MLVHWALGQPVICEINMDHNVLHQSGVKVNAIVNGNVEGNKQSDAKTGTTIVLLQHVVLKVYHL